MARASPRKTHKYNTAFKLTALRMSQLPGLQVTTAAASLDIHPFMLPR